MGVEPEGIHIRPMKRKWGACSSEGQITMNPELLSGSWEFQTEVILHELVHPRVPNHGPLFQALLWAYLAQIGIEPETL